VAVITLTQALVSTLGVNGVRWRQHRYDMSSHQSDANGNSQDRLGGPPRWGLTIAAPEGLETDDAVLWEELMLQLRGRVNYLLAWDPKRPVPRGTMRGTMVLDGAHSAGATTLNVTVIGTGQVGNTILRGSPLQISSGLGTLQLVRTIGDATAANVGGNSDIALTIEPPLLRAYSNATAVTWDKASTYFKATGNGVAEWSYHTRGIQQGFAIDLLERWT